MIPSSALCRAQEDHHRRRAADTPLENVRRIATMAAAAWAREAATAECRESRHARLAVVPDVAVAGSSMAATGYDRLTSENPDRGFAAERRI